MDSPTAFQRFCYTARLWFATLKPCLLAILVSLAVPVSFLFVEQATEVLRCLLEGPPKAHPAMNTQFLSTAFALTVLCLAAWYFTRVLLYIHFPDSPRLASVASGAYLRAATDWLPRALGVVPALGLGLALIIAVPSRHRPSGAFGSRLFVATTFCFILAALLILFFIKRKRTRLLYYSKNFRELDADTRQIITACLIISATLFLLLLLFPVKVAQTLGSAAIIMLAGASWIAYASLGIYFGHMLRIPVTGTVLVALTLFSFTNDNHKVRTLKTMPPPAQGLDLETYYSSWYTNLCQKFPTEQEHPVIVIAAAGGGIRAALWTATVLGALQDANPAFADHLFAISSVSGGSLGAAVFDALLSKNCPSGEVRTNAQDVLSHDFLSPTLAYMLFPDTLQRFVPFPIRCFDRARALEYAWEDAWRRSQKDSSFTAPFAQLWQGKCDHTVPALFFNGTLVETGDRLITSNIRIDASFRSCEEVTRWLDHDIRLSTAVNMSARFTYVSPAGVLSNSYHVVDGGYFENSGAATALDLLQSIEETSKANSHKVRFFVIVITSENAPRLSPDQVPPASNFLGEALAPLEALLQSRNARGIYAETILKAAYPVNAFQFMLANTNSSFALGWSLSQQSIRQMNSLLKTDPLQAQLSGILQSLQPKQN